MEEETIDARWYETFFEGIALEMWRKAIPPEQTLREAAFLERALELRAGARVLDVPCGQGRHSVELASRGHVLTGVDLSAEGLEQARSGAAAAGVSVEWRHGDMRDLPWTAAFDAAYCFGNSFGYLQPGDTRAFLQAVAKALKPGARFAMDTGMAAESILPNRQERQWMQFDDILFLEENRYHAADSCVETIYTFVRGGERRTRTGFQFVYTLRELRDLLSGAGLETRQILGSIDGEPFEVGRQYLVLLAQRV